MARLVPLYHVPTTMAEFIHSTSFSQEKPKPVRKRKAVAAPRTNGQTKYVFAFLVSSYQRSLMLKFRRPRGSGARRKSNKYEEDDSDEEESSDGEDDDQDEDGQEDATEAKSASSSDDGGEERRPRRGARTKANVSPTSLAVCLFCH